MRCEGADNPPCRRCRHTGLECLFEKPSREATLTGEAGLESVCAPIHFLVLIALFSWTDASAVWRIMLLRSAEHSWLSQKNCPSCCTTYVLVGSMQIDLLQQPHSLHFQSLQIIPSHRLYRYRILLPRMRRLRVLLHRSPQCIACLRLNIEILFQALDIKEVRPVTRLFQMTTSHPCIAIIRVVQALTCMVHHLKGLFYLRFLPFSRWLHP